MSLLFTPSHTGVCVRDLDKAMRFYVDGLGFEVGPKYDIDRPISETSGDVRLVSQFLKREALLLELLYWISPQPIGEPSAKRYQLGLTHLSFVVDDVHAAGEWLARHGGTIVEGTYSHSLTPNEVEILFVSDPDGTRVELMRLPNGMA
ncbi:VOC family protein [Phytohabitans sp. ZYX-F-186]|uniref:VOC family protein n=1 Tax=Phytohabitans maris TaxID=3071409 RepID=A0ABU0Z9J3_9ACTN|nr:VOC family protein [Phytohabitans sp. ZYX-F-186]MDQ7903731.1 VOC family protein [Phytohabitans sp. ZYX-F-186]